MNKTAILVDGDFFIRRARILFGKMSSQELATKLWQYCYSHLTYKKDSEAVDYLYRIFFYDCPPPDIKIHHPLTKQVIDTFNSEQARWRRAFHEALLTKRKVALRLGSVDTSNPSWSIDYKQLKKLCNGKITIDNLQEHDFSLNQRQKGVDMRIGLDIASITFKKQANKIILISGDSDFVPAAKLARREGVDFVLDPLWATIKPDLNEHIDGLRTLVPNPRKDPGKLKSKDEKQKAGEPHGQEA